MTLSLWEATILMTYMVMGGLASGAIFCAAERHEKTQKLSAFSALSFVFLGMLYVSWHESNMGIAPFGLSYIWTGKMVGLLALWITASIVILGKNERFFINAATKWPGVDYLLLAAGAILWFGAIFVFTDLGRICERVGC